MLPSRFRPPSGVLHKHPSSCRNTVISNDNRVRSNSQGRFTQEIQQSNRSKATLVIPKQKAPSVKPSTSNRMTPTLPHIEIAPQYAGLQVFDDMKKAIERADETTILGAITEYSDYISSTDKIDLMATSQIQNLIIVLQPILFIEIHDPPPMVVFSDEPIILKSEFTPILAAAVNLLKKVLSHLKPAVLEQLISRNFIKSIVQRLRTPFQSEQAEIEELINSLNSSLVVQRATIFHSMVNLIEGYRDEAYTHYCVAPCLRFFANYFSTNAINNNHITFFRSSIFRLYSTPSVNEYYQQLIKISHIFYQKDTSLAVWCQDYLLRHWPKTSSMKQVIYLKQIADLSQSIQPHVNERMTEMLFRKVAGCIRSSNFKVSNAGLELTRNQAFLQTYSKMVDLTYPLLLPAVQKASRHWNENVKQLALEVTQYLFSKNMSVTTSVVTSIDIREAQAEGAQQGWLAVTSFAQAYDPTLTLAKFEVHKDIFI